MHIHFLDPYRPRSSLVHGLDARVKFVLAVAFIVSTALIPPGAWPAYILLCAAILSVEILSDLGVGYVLKRSALAIPFLMAALPLIFTAPPPYVATFSVGDWTLGLSLEGLVRFASIALKSWISVQAAIVLAATTPFPELLVAMRAVHIPRLLVAIVGLMWRYLFVMADEALRLMRARQARSGQSDQVNLKPGGSVAWRARVAGGMAGNLFVRSIERSERIYMAMLARGYDGEVRSLPLSSLKPFHWLILAVCLGLLAGLVGLAYLM